MRALCLMLALASPAVADVVLATRTLRAGTQIAATDLALGAGIAPPGAAQHPDEVMGLEARVTLYAGRPIPLASMTEPAMVERNQLVTLLFQVGGLEIRAEGRALARGAGGEEVRVMNLGSRNAVFGTVVAPGLVRVP